MAFSGILLVWPPNFYFTPHENINKTYLWSVMQPTIRGRCREFGFSFTGAVCNPGHWSKIFVWWYTNLCNMSYVCRSYGNSRSIASSQSTKPFQRFLVGLPVISPATTHSSLLLGHIAVGENYKTNQYTSSSLLWLVAEWWSLNLNTRRSSQFCFVFFPWLWMPMMK